MAASDVPPRPPSGFRSLLRRPVVLCVDSHPDELEFLQELLQWGSGYEVRTATSVAGARAVLASASVDLVIADYFLPDGIGTALIREARAEGLLEAAGAIIMTSLPIEPPDGMAVVRKPILDGAAFLDELVPLLTPSVLGREGRGLG